MTSAINECQPSDGVFRHVELNAESQLTSRRERTHEFRAVYDNAVVSILFTFSQPLGDDCNRASCTVVVDVTNHRFTVHVDADKVITMTKFAKKADEPNLFETVVLTTNIVGSTFVEHELAYLENRKYLNEVTGFKIEPIVERAGISVFRSKYRNGHDSLTSSVCRYTDSNFTILTEPLVDTFDVARVLAEARVVYHKTPRVHFDKFGQLFSTPANNADSVYQDAEVLYESIASDLFVNDSNLPVFMNLNDVNIKQELRTQFDDIYRTPLMKSVAKRAAAVGVLGGNLYFGGLL